MARSLGYCAGGNCAEAKLRVKAKGFSVGDNSVEAETNRLVVRSLSLSAGGLCAEKPKALARKMRC